MAHGARWRSWSHGRAATCVVVCVLVVVAVLHSLGPSSMPSKDVMLTPQVDMRTWRSPRPLPADGVTASSATSRADAAEPAGAQRTSAYNASTNIPDTVITTSQVTSDASPAQHPSSSPGATGSPSNSMTPSPLMDAASTATVTTALTFIASSAGGASTPTTSAMASRSSPELPSTTSAHEPITPSPLMSPSSPEQPTPSSTSSLLIRLASSTASTAPSSPTPARSTSGVADAGMPGDDGGAHQHDDSDVLLPAQDQTADPDLLYSAEMWSRFNIDAHAPKRCGATLEMLHDECNRPPDVDSVAAGASTWVRNDRVFVRHTGADGVEIALQSLSGEGRPCVGDTYTAKLTYVTEGISSAKVAPGYAALELALWAASFDHCNGLYGFRFEGVLDHRNMAGGTWRLEIFHRSTAFRDYWVHTGPLACSVLVGDLVVPKSDADKFWPRRLSVVPLRRRDGNRADTGAAASLLFAENWSANPLMPPARATQEPSGTAGSWIAALNSMSTGSSTAQAKYNGGGTIATVHVSKLNLTNTAIVSGADLASSQLPDLDQSAVPDDDTDTQRLRRLRASKRTVGRSDLEASKECAASDHAALANSAGVWWPSFACRASTDGGWPCRGGPAPPPAVYAADVVSWVPDVVRSQQVGCAFRHYTPAEVAQHLQDIGIARFLFLGDSLTRNTLFEFVSFLRGLNANVDPTGKRSYNHFPIAPLPLPRAKGTLDVDGVRIKYEWQQVYGAADPPAFRVDCGLPWGFDEKETLRMKVDSHYYHHAYKRIVSGDVAIPDILVLGSLGMHDMNIGRPYTMFAGLANLEQFYLLLKSRGFNGPVIARESTAPSPFISKSQRPESQYWAWSYNLELRRLAAKHGWLVHRAFDATITRPDRAYDGVHVFPVPDKYPKTVADFPRSLSSMQLQRFLHLLLSLPGAVAAPP